jgi:hypothetical protein
MRALLWIVLIAVALSVLHYVALWAERRGWIFYKHRKASPGRVGSAFMEVQSLLQPGTRHAVESRLEDVAEEDESGDPPSSRRADDEVG